MERKLPRMWDSLRHDPSLSSFTLMTKVFKGYISHQSKNILPEGILSLLFQGDDQVKKKNKKNINFLLVLVEERSGAAYLSVFV